MRSERAALELKDELDKATDNVESARTEAEAVALEREEEKKVKDMLAGNLLMAQISAAKMVRERELAADTEDPALKDMRERAERLQVAPCAVRGGVGT